MSDATSATPAETAATGTASPEQTAPTTTEAEAAPPVATPPAAPVVTEPRPEPTRNTEARITALQEQNERLALRRKEAEEAQKAAEQALRMKDAEMAIMRYAPHLSPETVAVMARGLNGTEDIDTAAKRLADELAPKQVLTTRAPGNQVEPLPDDPRERLRVSIARSFGGK